MNLLAKIVDECAPTIDAIAHPSEWIYFFDCENDRPYLGINIDPFSLLRFFLAVFFILGHCPIRWEVLGMVHLGFHLQ